MKTLVTALAVCFVVAGVSAQQQQQQQQQPPAQEAQKPADTEITLTGCVVQGSGPTVFIFENARKDPKSTSEPAAKYIVVAAAEDLNLRQHLNHSVTIVGVSDGKPVVLMTQKVEEKDLPRISAKSVVMVADTCTSGR